ncbi:MAG: hypothetical protein Q9220_001057 [cf. Caloplaca sp. 1 TL-2023]
MQPQVFVALLITSLSLFRNSVCHRAGGHATYKHRDVHLHQRDISPPLARHGTLSFNQTANVTRVIINSPPINLLTGALIEDLHDFLVWTQPAPFQTTPKVVIFSSANPDYFISHFDLNLLSGPPIALNQLVACGRLLQSVTSTAFIAEINGRTYGGGQELSSQMDMRFAGPNALVSQYENSEGFVAQAGGQLFLGPIVGKARAMEHLLASKAIDAPTGTHIGLFNANYRDAGTLTRQVDALAARIGLFPQSSLNDTKWTLNYLNPTVQQLDDQITRFAPIAQDSRSQGAVRETIEISDETENTFEMNIPNTVLQGLYQEELAAMPDGGRGVLAAARY